MTRTELTADGGWGNSAGLSVSNHPGRDSVIAQRGGCLVESMTRAELRELGILPGPGAHDEDCWQWHVDCAIARAEWLLAEARWHAEEAAHVEINGTWNPCPTVYMAEIPEWLDITMDRLMESDVIDPALFCDTTKRHYTILFGTDRAFPWEVEP